MYAQEHVEEGGEATEIAIQNFDQTTRADRLELRLLDRERGLISALRKHHHIDLIAIVGDEPRSIWESRSGEPVPQSFDSIPSADYSDLTIGLLDTISAAGDALQDQYYKGATVLFSDGQHNQGASPIQVAGISKSHQATLFTVGYGYQDEPTDLALLHVEYPDTVHKTDRIRGSLVVKDQMPEGTSYVASIRHGEQTVWQEELRALNVPQRRIDFDFTIDDLVEAEGEKFDAGVEHNSLQLGLTAELIPVKGETETGNNSREIRIAAITQQQKILMIDGRSRWETRYLRNLFQRDTSWEMNAIIVGPDTENENLPRGDSFGMFPTSTDELFKYNIIVLGDVSPDLFRSEEVGWIRDFVDRRGGGLVLIDGRRGHLKAFDALALGPLLPVNWTSAKNSQSVRGWSLPKSGPRMLQ